MSCSLINNAGISILQLLAILLLKWALQFLIRKFDPDFARSKRSKKNRNNREKSRFKRRRRDLAKIENMMKSELDIKKPEEEKKKGACKYLKKINDFLCVEFFCNFLMAIQLDVLLGVCLAI